MLKELLRTLWGDGRIFDGDAVSLLAKLCAADSQLRDGHISGAIGVLLSAQNQIDQLKRNGFIAEDAAKELIKAMDLIMDAL